MADLLSIGSSALLAYRRALDTTSHNIANVNTPGYSRQRVELATPQASGSGSGFIGSGVEVTTVRRIVDGLLNAQLQSDTAAYARLDVYAGFAGRVDQLLSNADTSLATPLQQFFDAANALAQNPSSTAARQTLIGSAQTLAARFNDTQAQLDAMAGDVDARLRGSVGEINRLGAGLAQLNERIALAQGLAGGQPPNDLLDERDRLLQELAGHIGVTTVSQDDGSLNVFTTGGQALVLGNRATALGVTGDGYGGSDAEISFGNAIVTSQLGGGALGGLLDVRREIIDPARAELGQLAIGIARAVNDQHAQGVDAHGDSGGLFFAAPTATALAARANGGDAAIEIGFGDPAALRSDDYELRYGAGGWELSSLSGGNSIALSGTGSAADPLRGAGLELTVSGSAAVGDRFLLRPTADAAGQMRVAIGDPSRVAAASAGAGANSGDNGNAQALAALANRGVLDGGRISLAQYQSTLATGAGLDAQQAQLRLDAQGALQTQARNARESVSGVNLDEEAANLVRYQQAYQAAARVIQVADTLFQTLLQATGR